MAQVHVVLKTAEGVMNAMAVSAFTAGMPWTAIVTAMGALQLAAINNTKPPEFAEGGVIGGRRHAQGGTIIEAERGEFILNKKSVKRIGIGNLKRMNRSG